MKLNWWFSWRSDSTTSPQTSCPLNPLCTDTASTGTADAVSIVEAMCSMLQR